MVVPATVAGQPISLPSGGGSVRGLGETFEPNLFTGTGNHVVPIAVSPGRNGFGPALALEYSSGNGNGPFGLGWQLSIPRVTRKTERGLPHYDSTDAFVMSGVEDLVPLLERSVDSATGEQSWSTPEPVKRGSHVVTQYRPRTETAFSRIEQWQDLTTGETQWRTISRDNVTSVYGATPAARIAAPDHPQRIYEWLLEETYDALGNHTRYEYAGDPETPTDEIFESTRRATQRYIRRICYGNLPNPLVDSDGRPVTYLDGSAVGRESAGRKYAFEVVFDYGDWDLATPDVHPPPLPPGQLETFDASVPLRADRFSTFRPRFEVRTLRRCRRVLMFHHFAELGGATLVRSTDLHYSADPITLLSLLTSVTVTSYRRDGSGSYTSANLPPVSFAYSEFRPDEQRFQSLSARGSDGPPASLGDGQFALVDLFGDGLPDVVQSNPNGLRYWRNLGFGVLDRPRSLNTVPADVQLGDPGVGFADMGGDGQADLLVHSSSLPGFYETTADGTWHRFRPYDVPTGFELDDPNLRLLDLTGDGLSDALVTADEHFLWYRGQGEQGFSTPERIPRTHDLAVFPDISFNDPGQSVRLADMNGDGLADIVVVHGHRVDYWPNLGFGRFAARITMGTAPQLEADFDPRRVFLVDLDGTGCADLVYVGFDRVHHWSNQSGNGWSEKGTILGTPTITDIDAIQFADVFGSGTATLLWTYAYARHPEGNYKALDFCDGTKPYVLVEMSNNMGATTRVSYSSSTRHSLRDLENGEPWITQLPFPVQVVDRVEVIDEVSRTKIVRRYAYHHGYYDGREREFRGFGRVDQYDTETLEEFAGSSFYQGQNPLENVSSAFHSPPVEIRSWYHTGVYFEEDSTANLLTVFDYRELTNRFRAEFYRGDTDAKLLEEHRVVTDGDPRAAHRSLRGALLRKEVFSRDGSVNEVHPHQVTETRYEVIQLQPGDRAHPAVFTSHPLESHDYHYERDPTDPRITHMMTLQVDSFSNPLRSVVIGYGRRNPDQLLPAQADRDCQARTVVVYSENRYTNAVNDLLLLPDDHRAPLLCEARTYELTGFSPANGGEEFTLEEFRTNDFARLVTPASLAYEELPDESLEQKRLIEHVRTLYRSDDLRTLLPLGVAEPLGLPGQTMKLALTAGLVADIYGTLVTDGMLASDGGYVHSEGDTDWWIPSERVYFSQDASDLPAAERAVAEAHFFSLRRVVNAFDQPTVVRFDPYDLLVQETLDAVGNRSTADIDYRLLQPFRTTDANGNRTEAAFDTIGMVAGTAVMGKESEGAGDTMSQFVPELTSAERDAFFADPAGHASVILAGATTRVVYDVDRFRRTGTPIVVAVISRATHASEPVPTDGLRVDVSVRYSDGFGREVQRKGLVEPGPLTPGGADIAPRWLGTGWTIFDNKGKPVRHYQPFFDDTAAFVFGRRIGVSSTLFHDPTERVVATLHADHTWSKVVFGPWREESWDANDTVLVADPATDPDVGSLFGRLAASEYLPTWYEQRASGALGAEEQTSAAKTAMHAATPRVTYADSLGRTFLTVAHNRCERGGSIIDETYATRVVLDVEGNQRAVIETNDRILMLYQYDMLGTRVHQSGADAGERWTLLDVLGQPIYAWDSRGQRSRHTFDALRRPSEHFVSDQSNSERLVVRTEYGESLPAAEVSNLRGRIAQIFDGAGTVTNEEYDFKGNLLVSRRQFLEDYKSSIDWGANPVLESETFVTTKSYDAQNRTDSITTPDGSVYRPTYNVGGLLERIEIGLRGATTSTQFVSDVDYDAYGRRTHVHYGNGVAATFEYDPMSSRLNRLSTSRGSRLLQDLVYTDDPTGHIVHVADNAQQAIYFANQVVGAASSYSYDALYRLITAEGREHVGQLSQAQNSWDDAFRTRLPHPGDGQAMRRYVEHYDYDALGNILTTVHRAAQGNWTRTYNYNESSLLEPTKRNNRLSSIQVGSGPVEQFSYDEHANMLTMPHLGGLGWGHRDELRTVELSGGGTAHYIYDAAGERVRKVVERAGSSAVEERRYVGSYEVLRRRVNGVLRFERETLNVMADTNRVAFVETRTLGADGSLQQHIRYQLGNHLGSAVLEVDDIGRVLTFEEYYPYGSTSYQAVRSQTQTPKRYRFSGRERDDETGLQYHTLRYYAPWLCRWVSADPLGITGGMNLFGYAGQDPIGNSDVTGLEPTLAELRSFNLRADANFDHQISADELFKALSCTEKVTARAWFANMVFFRGYRVDEQLMKLSVKFRNDEWARRAREAERFYASSENTLRVRADGTTYTNRAAREETKRYMNRHRDPRRLIPTAVVAAAVIFPEAVGVISAWDTGVKTGETITGQRSGVRVTDLMTGNIGVAGTKLTDADRAAAAKEAALGWAAIGFAFVLSRPPTMPAGPPKLSMAEIKSLPDYPRGLRHLSEMEGRGIYNTSGNVALALYDPSDGAVILQVFGPRVGSSARTVIWEGQIGWIQIPKGMTPPQIGNAVEEPVRQLVGRATGQSFPTKAANAHGPDIHIPTGQ